MSLTTGDTVFLCISLTGFTGIFSCLGYGLYLSHTEMERMLQHLRNCYIITSRLWYLKLGLSGRMVMLGSIAGIFVFPKMHLTNGTADLDDMNNFPISIKSKLIWFYWISLASLSTIVLLVLAEQVGIFI